MKRFRAYHIIVLLFLAIFNAQGQSEKIDQRLADEVARQFIVELEEGYAYADLEALISRLGENIRVERKIAQSVPLFLDFH